MSIQDQRTGGVIRGRGGRPRKRGRGLPDEAARLQLARTYLVEQRRHWPDAGLPEPTDATLAGYAEAFRRRFLGEDHGTGGDDARVCPAGAKPGACYCRYSSDHSDERSLDQQLQRELERARRENVFVDWRHVFVDAAWTGTVAARTGYQLARTAMRDPAGPRVLLVDEVGRASRDSVETLTLARDLARAGRRLIGVSDGIDTDQDHADALLHVHSMTHSGFVKSLQGKVDRGMRWAFKAGRPVGRPAFGHKQVPAVGPDGKPLFKRNGKPLHDFAVDEEAARIVLEVFEHYTLRGWSPTRIAKWLNDRRAGGKATWDRSEVRDLLGRRTYAGVETWNTEHQDKDPETGVITTVKRPRSEWLVRRVPHLKIVPWRLWRTTQKRLAGRAGLFPNGGGARAVEYPVTLLRPVCGSCEWEMVLGRGGKYASWYCVNSLTNAHGCSHKGYKSVRVFETAVLAAVRERLFGELFLERVVAEANAFLALQATAPRADLEPRRRAIKEADEERKLLTGLIVKHGKDGVSSLVERLMETERRLKEMRKELALDEAAAAPPPAPLTASDVSSVLGDLRGLLDGEKEAAAPVLRELTGPVVVRQEAEPGAKRPAWFAEFGLDLAKVAVRLGGKGDCPGRETWEFLSTRKWTTACSAVRVRAEHVRTWEKLAPRAAELAAEGRTTGAIADRLGTDWVTAKAALAFARTGERKPSKPAEVRKVWKRGRPRPGGVGEAAPFRRLAAEAVRLRDGESLTWEEVGRRLGVAGHTARRAYRHAQAADVPHRPARRAG